MEKSDSKLIEECLSNPSSAFESHELDTTLEQIHADIREAVNHAGASDSIAETLIKNNYILVNELHQVKPHIHYVRWLHAHNNFSTLTPGAKLMSIKPYFHPASSTRATPTVTCIFTCINYKKKVFQYDFNSSYTFRKLTKDELLLLHAKSILLT